MANYTPIFEKPYPNGYEDLPSETTPVTAQTLNDKDDAIVNIETYLEENPIGEGGSLATLSDVSITTPTGGQTLKYNAETEKWENGSGGGGSANVWEGSHAEYEEEKTQIADETTLLFNDDIGLEAESDYYSEVEQVIGTYMGKPLYRKCFNYGSLPSTGGSWEYKSHGISNVDEIVTVKGIVTFSDGNQAPLPYITQTATAQIGVIANTTNVGVMVGYDRHTASAYFTLEYTKTTDSVVGVVGGIKKGDNYSTNEQVIGTWIDGKPLYRKVIDYGYGSSTTGSYVYKAHGINNIDTITKVNGTVKFASGQVSELPFVSSTALNSQVSIVADADNVGYMSNASRATEYFVFILEYTKTTD